MILWLMVIIQMIAWAGFSLNGGILNYKKFLIFTVAMLLGQLAAGIETYQMESWRAFVTQIYFFVFTAVGGIKRFRQKIDN